MSDQPYCHYPQCGCPNKKSKSDCFKGYPLEGSMTAPSETSQELQCICKLMWAQGAYPEFHCDKHGFMQTNRHAIDAIVEAACLRNELQAALAESRAECERLREQVYVPGVWKCAKCKMELVASILAVSSSSIHADNRPQECPNNCGPMWRITERDQRKEAQALHEKEFMRAQAAETREREAYERAAKDVAAKQAKIDALMLEYCPNEMTENQIATWKDAQVVVPRETEDAIIRALAGERREGVMDIHRLWDQIEHDLGWNDHNMQRERPYNGQPHTSTGARGATEINGITFRDLRDCYIRARCLAMGANCPENMPYYTEACKGVNAVLCENDVYKLKGDADEMAVFQNLSCEIEKLMGIYPNVQPLDIKP